MTDQPLPRDRLPTGLEERTAAFLLHATGDPQLARAVFAFAHGMVLLELTSITARQAIRQTQLSVMVGEPPAEVVDYDTVVAGSQTPCPRWLRWLGQVVPPRPFRGPTGVA